MYIVLNYHLSNGIFLKTVSKKPKTFVETILDWTPEELVFNTIAWKEGYRFFGCSRDLSNAMKRPVKENLPYTWLQTSIHHPNRGDEENIIIQKNPTLKSG